MVHLPSIDEARLAEDEDVQGVQDVAAPDRDHEHVAPLGREEGVTCKSQTNSNMGFMAMLQEFCSTMFVVFFLKVLVLKVLVLKVFVLKVLVLLKMFNSCFLGKELRRD